MSKHAEAARQPSLRKPGRGTVSKILSANQVSPQKIQYYLERRDSRVRRQDGAGSAYLQRGRDRAQERRSPAASGSLALLRQKARYSSHREYRPGIDLLSGEVLGLVRKRHRSAEFIEFLRLADANYPAGTRIRIGLDNHSTHISKQTRAFLAMQFTFTPKHGSWLDLIESFFAKMAKTLLRGIRVAPAGELKARIELYLKQVSETPVVFR